MSFIKFNGKSINADSIEAYWILDGNINTLCFVEIRTKSGWHLQELIYDESEKGGYPARVEAERRLLEISAQLR